MKKILSLVLTVCMLLSVCAMPAMAQEAVAMSQMQTKDIITITVDGKAVDCAAYGQLPVIVEGRTLVPLRSVFEALGATVEWNNELRSVTSVKGDVTITLAVDSKDMVVNGEVKVLDVPAQIMNDRTMVPVRAVAEAFGAKVEWNNDTRTVVITAVVGEMTPVDVVKAAYEAMFAFDLEECGKYYVNPEAAMGELAGATNVSEMVGMVADDEELTEEQAVLVENFTKDMLSFISYEITGMSVTDDKAEVYVTIVTPDFDNMQLEEYMTEDAIMLLMFGIIEELGYSLEDMEALTPEEEALLQNALVAGVFEYIVAAIEAEAETAGYLTTEDVEILTKVDGKWFIAE